MRARPSFIFVILVLVSKIHVDNCDVLRRVKRIVGGNTAAPPPVDDPVVYVTKFDKDAIVYGAKDNLTEYYLFRGIRYAEPPLGSKRFQRPKAVPLEGEVDATQWGPPCIQTSKDGKVLGNEDCLYLNVFTPVLPDATEGYPVLIWIHGGGFRRGAATQYDMRKLVDKSTIVVSIQYRLGSLGFLSTASKDLSGNNGLFDMMLAIEWVRDYIEFFGGNKNNIVAFGQGTGACSAFLLGLSQFGQSYIRGIIAMSGSLLSNFAVDRAPLNTTKALAKDCDCPNNNTVEMVRCLREIPADTIVEKDHVHVGFLKQARNFLSDLSSILGAGPVVEGTDDQRSLPNFVGYQPDELINRGNFKNIALLTGVIKDETGGAVHGPYKETISQVLTAIPDFIIKNLIPNLQVLIPQVEDIAKQYVPEAFSKYVKLPNWTKSQKTVDNIVAVSETLNDALFNAPAFLTVKHWSKSSKAFMYSFDHPSKRSYGKYFLDGEPLVDSSGRSGKTSHGDELGYIFDPNDIDGNPIDLKINWMDPEEEQVQEAFTNVIANFARSGDVNGDSSVEGTQKLPFSLPSFNFGNDEKTSDSYLSIKSKPEVSKNYRFCEMGLWTGIEERLLSSACSLFKVNIPNPFKIVRKGIKVPNLKLPNVTIPGIDKIDKIPGVDKIDKIIPGSIPTSLPNIPKPDLPKKLPFGNRFNPFS